MTITMLLWRLQLAEMLLPMALLQGEIMTTAAKLLYSKLNVLTEFRAVFE